ncbi:MAG TPA: hypothetical protein VGH20_21440 [Myxococcales bacterium]|jgi:hypothetical protein
MIVLAGWYRDRTPARAAELLECVRRNCANPAVSEVHLCLEDGSRPDLIDAKLRLLEHGRRLTFRDAFAYANGALAGRRVALANADIYFDETLALLNGHDLRGKLLCLSRWDVQPDGSSKYFDFSASQDAWIFEAPLPQLSCDWHLGIPGCDNRIAHEAAQAGLRLWNPSRSIRAHHLHASAVRHYTESQRLSGPGAAVPGSYLGTVPEGPTPAAPLAAVRFRESMGYTVARFAPGASSHNNDARPFQSVPEPLRGRPFTQVVAWRASPLEVEFRSGGKVYVLVGTDWNGYLPATEFLRAHGHREPLPDVWTGRGTSFEVWSLMGSAGERVSLPTQVMLVAAELRRR